MINFDQVFYLFVKKSSLDHPGTQGLRRGVVILLFKNCCVHQTINLEASRHLLTVLRAFLGVHREPTLPRTSQILIFDAVQTKYDTMNQNQTT